MKTARHLAWHRGLLYGLVAAVVCGFAAPPATASFEFSKPRWDGATEFLKLAREQLGHERVVLGVELDWESLNERDAVLLLHPTVPIEATEASAFMSAGGRFAVIDDYGKGDQFLARFQIRRALAPVPPRESFLDNPKLAIARPVLSGGSRSTTFKHPIAAQVDHVITNHPTALVTASEVELTPVMTLAGADDTEALFAVVGVIGDGAACGLDDGVPKQSDARCGRLFAMADPSVFIDLMMQFEGNRALARGLVDYLVENDAWGLRGGKLYVLVGAFQQTGHYGGQNDLSRQIESALNTLESWFETTREDGLPTHWLWALALCAAVGTGIWAWGSSGKLYRPPVPRYTKGMPLLSQAGYPGRAAVLSAPTTHPALVLLELKTAAEEFLRQRLRLPHTTSSGKILEAIESQGALDASSFRQLSNLFKELGRAEKALLGSQELRFRADLIKQTHQELAEILVRVKASASQSPA